MTRTRKVATDQIVLTANRMLAKSTTSKEAREGIMVLARTLLHNARAYNGFRYLDQSEVPEGFEPGIVRGNFGAEGNYKIPDDTRIAFL